MEAGEGVSWGLSAMTYKMRPAFDKVKSHAQLLVFLLVLNNFRITRIREKYLT
jgi:hypothetical protein